MHAIPYEILIIDNGSVDATADTVAAHASPLIRYLFEPRRGASNARNTGVQHAAAKLIAFLDDDLLPGPDWLPSIKQTMEAHPEVDCVGGRIEPQWPGERPVWLTPANYAPLALQYGRGAGKPLSATNASGCLVAANFICRREVLRDVGDSPPPSSGTKTGSSIFACGARARSGIYADNIVATAVVQPERLTKAYHRRWHAVTGANHARLRFKQIISPDGHITDPVTRHCLFGTPAYVYKELGEELVKWVRAFAAGHRPETFTVECRARYLASYIWTRALEDFKAPRTAGLPTDPDTGPQPSA